MKDRGVQPLTLGKVAWVLAVEAAFLFGTYQVARALDAQTPEFYGFLVLQTTLFIAFALVYIHQLRTLPDAPDLQRARTRRAHRWVLASWHGGALVTVAVGAIAIWQRSSMELPSATLFWASAVLLCGTLLWVLAGDAGLGRRDRERPPSVIQVSTALMLVPIVVTWMMVSGYWWRARPPAPAVSEQVLATMRKGRSDAARAAKVTVAVTLSGGAYRAGAFHAGVLDHLEAEKIPIHYLSTNSGGSIIGAYYALGHTPEEFIQRYAANGGPRLSNDFFSLGAIVGHLVVSGYTTGDMFTHHLGRVFFGSRAMTEGCFPKLLVNVTEYKSGAGRTYQCPQEGREDGDVPVARAVAASGAMPVIASSVQIGTGYFMDGAARDNLGYVGLQSYLENHATQPRPGFLVLSNATLPLEPDPPPHKVWLLPAFIRGYTALLDEERRQVIRTVTTRGYRSPLPSAATLEKFGITPDRVRAAVAEMRAEVARDGTAAAIIRREPAVLDEFPRNRKIFEEARNNPKLLDDFKRRVAAADADAVLRRLASVVVASENAYAVVLTLADIDRSPVPPRYLVCSGQQLAADKEREIRGAVRLSPFQEPTAQQMALVRCLGRTMAQARKVGCRLAAVKDLKDPDAQCGPPDL